eukprot:UC4_evm10s776
MVFPISWSDGNGPFSLSLSAVREMETGSDYGRGRLLVELYDQAIALSKAGIFTVLLISFSKLAPLTAGADPDRPKMTRNAFSRGLVQIFGLDLDEDYIANQFYEVVGYPEDDGNEQDNGDIDSKKSMSEGEFATGLARIANQLDLMTGGALENTETFATQLYSLVANGCRKMVQNDKGHGSLEQKLDESKTEPRSPESFGPPDSFAGTNVICYLDISIDSEVLGRIEIELDTKTCPKTSYNFMKLCCEASTAKTGELTKKPLSFQDCVFHRCIRDFCLQTGDFENGDGSGGESIYGGDFEDENFDIKHSSFGQVSMANNGPSTNNSQFFFLTSRDSDTSSALDGDNVCFGRVINGLDFLIKMNSVESDNDDRPLKNIKLMDDIQGWLSDIDPALARKYTDILVENGFDDLDALHHIDEETLDDLLIHDVTDRTAILLAIESLGPPGYPVSSPSRESSVGSDYYINADISSGSYDEKGEDDIFSAYHDPEDHDDDIYQEPVMTDISSDNDIVADLGSSTFQSRRSSEFPGSFSGPQKHAERRNTAPEIRIDPPASPPTPSSTSRPSSLLSVNHEQWGSVAANGQLRVTIIRARDLSGGDSPPSTSVKLVSLSGLTPQELTFGKTRLVKADRNPNFLENFTLLVKPDSHCFFVIYVRQRNATRNTWDEIGSCRIFLEWATEGHPCKELWHPLRDGASSSSRCVGEILIKLEWSQGTTNERQRSYLGRMEEEFPTDCFAFRKLYEGSYALPQAKNGSCALEYLVAVVENVIYLKLKGTLFLSDYRLVHIPYTEKHRNRQLCIMLSSITKVDLVYGEDGGFELQIGDRSFKLLRFVVPFGEDGAKPKRSSANEESTEDSSFKSTIREGMKSAFKEAKRMARAATGDKSLDVKKATPDSISSLGARRCLLALIRLSEEIRWICREGDFDWTLSHGIDDNLAPWGRLPHCTVRRLCTQKNNSCDFSVVLAKGIPDLGSVTKTPQSSPSDNKKQGAEAIKSAMKRINLHKNNAWKIIVNIDEFNCHKICETYPPLIVVPSKFRTDIIIKASKFRTKRRLPSLTWIHPENKAPLVRCAQPKTGMLKNLIPEDTLLLNAIRETVTNIFDDPAKEVLRIFDARPFVNAAANAATKGAGFENIKELGGNQRAKIEWLNIGNIHAVRSSIQELHDNTDSHFFGAVGGWIEHIHNILEGSVAIMTALNFGQPTLVHCSDGWDRTAQLCATAQLLLDPHYRTIDGFAELVNKDWCDYGYQFEKRSSGFGKEFERKDISPIFEQWLDV